MTLSKEAIPYLFITLFFFFASSCTKKSTEQINYGEWAVLFNTELGTFAKDKMTSGMQRVIIETYPNENSKLKKCQVVVTEKETVLGMRGNLVQTFRERTFEQIPKKECEGIKPSDAPYNNESPQYVEKRIYSTPLGFLGQMRRYHQPTPFKNGSIVQKDSYFRTPEGLTLESKYFHKNELFMHRKEVSTFSPKREMKRFLKTYGQRPETEINKTWHETYEFVSKREILRLLKKKVKGMSYMIDRYTKY